jgi:hypothetical protein
VLALPLEQINPAGPHAGFLRCGKCEVEYDHAGAGAGGERAPGRLAVNPIHVFLTMNQVHFVCHYFSIF